MDFGNISLFLSLSLSLCVCVCVFFTSCLSKCAMHRSTRTHTHTRLPAFFPLAIFRYQLLSMDGCNETTRALPCEAGGQLQMWKSPALRGPTASWEHVGPVFTSNATVLGDGVRGHLTKVVHQAICKCVFQAIHACCASKDAARPYQCQFFLHDNIPFVIHA